MGETKSRHWRTTKTIGKESNKNKYIPINNYFKCQWTKMLSSKHKRVGSHTEELILLKWTYYPKQPTDLMQSYQNTCDIFHRTRKIILKLTWNHKRIWNPNCQAILKKEQSWRYHPPGPQTLPQSYSQNSMVLAQINGREYRAQI